MSAYTVDPPSPFVWGVMTVLMEAAGESYEGKLGVAYVLLNRARPRNRALTEVVLQPLQFSCWNADSPTRRMLVNPPVAVWNECVKAMDAAMWAKEPDPTGGATHYVNLKVLPKPPAWYDERKVTARIGNHTFLRGV